ncbi:hypothetical protein QTL95_26135 [Rhizobium sp. S152]|uniref:hypothetical protein n=1 Tax=Rhizobium sp. S152 TaxID=3055038 RepID=UPI0025A93EB1|nr:hypothetical protein [Rhizobium sp. S152]MDM9629372.1 hypothetical protein [Rhizobium sp. S152]
MPSLQSLPSIEPLQRQRPARFTVGKDSNGRWVVDDREGRVGGVFISEHAALHFAAEECGRDLAEIRRAPDGVVLPFGTFAGDRFH